MSKRKQKVPPPFTTTTAPSDPGAHKLSDPDWVRRYVQYLDGLAQPDYSTGSESGINSN